MTPALFKALRKQTKLTAEQFGKKIGQRKCSIEKKEQGTRSITTQDIMLIEIIFKKELAKMKK